MRMLQKITIGGILATAVLASTTQAQPNLLVNGSFENSGGFTSNPIHQSGENQGWATFGANQNNMFNSPDYPHGYPAPGNNYALQTVNNPGNNWNPQGGYQIVSGITPGGIYTFSSWYLADNLGYGKTNFGSYATPVDLQIGFGYFGGTGGTNWVSLGVVGYGGKNLDWGFGGTPAPGSFGPSPAGSIPALDTWYQAGVSGIAPAGATDAIVYLFNMDNGQSQAQMVYFDDAALMQVPEPSLLALLGLAVPFWFMRRRQR